MALSIGIIGLPNVGKSTVFNALTGVQLAEVANYPFCTIQPNLAVVPLKDDRLTKLNSLVNVPNAIYATLEFVDIAGLVKGASRGEGLGNQFLSHVRNTDALIHVVRLFDDPNVIHVSGEINPIEDIEIINLELALADIAQLDRKIKKLESDIKGDKNLIPILALAISLKDHLAQGKSVNKFPKQDPEIFDALTAELRLLTAKPIILAVNVDETGLSEDSKIQQRIQQIRDKTDSDIVVLCAKLEEELIDMSLDEQHEFLALVGAKESGLDQVVRSSFNTLGLISYFTKNEKEVRAWNIPAGTKAPMAAGKIHTDFEKGFIRAEVVSFDVFEKFGSDAAVKSAGQMRSEGKDYIVQDGDVILFRFNV